MKDVKNIEIGWVIEILKDRYVIMPGYKPVRKIIYENENNDGFDLLYKHNNESISYPIIDFKNENSLMNTVKGEYMILPYGKITTYLDAFRINDFNGYKLNRIKELIFLNAHIVEKPLYLSKNIDNVTYNDEIQRLGEYKLIFSPIEPTFEEIKYLEKIR